METTNPGGGRSPGRKASGSRNARVAVLLALGLVAGLAVAGLLPGSSGADVRTRAAVKLYSDGKVVAQWESAGLGRMDGDSFVFPVRSGIAERQVRIRGTFAVEELE